jgi:hypothetical protein
MNNFRQEENTIENDMYSVSGYYMSIYDWRGFIDIQLRYNLFHGDEVDIFLNEKMNNFNLLSKQSLEAANAQIKIDYNNLLQSINRTNVVWANLPIQPIVTNYAIELLSGLDNNRYIITQSDTENPFEFYLI